MFVNNIIINEGHTSNVDHSSFDNKDFLHFQSIPICVNQQNLVDFNSSEIQNYLRPCEYGTFRIDF